MKNVTVAVLNELINKGCNSFVYVNLLYGEEDKAKANTAFEIYKEMQDYDGVRIEIYKDNVYQCFITPDYDEPHNLADWSGKIDDMVCLILDKVNFQRR